MISVVTARRVLSLLASGDSQRAVARATGVSRSTVRIIAAGRWKGFARHKLPALTQTAEAHRCSRCGRLVRLPCRACRTTAASPARRREISRTPVPILGLDLKPDDRRRYEKIAHTIAPADGPEAAEPTAERTAEAAVDREFWGVDA